MSARIDGNAPVGALAPMTDDRWARMSWHAQQQWLRAANALRKQLTAELDALTRAETARAEHRRLIHADTISAATALLATLGPDPDGHKHLEVLATESAPRTSAAYRARNAQGMRDLRARRRQESAA